jgi:hypothetical protein
MIPKHSRFFAVALSLVFCRIGMNALISFTSLQVARDRVTELRSVSRAEAHIKLT